MKRIAFLLIAIAIISSAAMAGDMAKSGQWGVQTSLGLASAPLTSTGAPSNSTVGLKFMASDNMAVRVEAGFASMSVNGVSNSSYGFGAGFEYHMESKGGSVSPYVGLGLGYYGVSVNGASNTPSTFSVDGVFGGEYFFSSAFSWAGQVGIGYLNESNAYYDATNNSYSSASVFGTVSATMILTWYVN